MMQFSKFVLAGSGLGLLVGLIVWQIMGTRGIWLALGLGGLIALTWLAMAWPLTRSLARHTQLERETLRANRALKVLSECNHALIRTTTESELLGEICRIIVVSGGYRLAWVGFAAEHPEVVELQAQYGYEADQIQSDETTANLLLRHASVRQVMRTGQASVVREIQTNAEDQVWRHQAEQFGYASIVSLPLCHQGTPFGALTIYAADPQAFTSDEVALLRNLADDMAYGIMVLRDRDQHAQTARSLEHFETKARALLDAIPDTILRFNRDGICVDVKTTRQGEPWPAPEGLVGQHVRGWLPAEISEHFELYISKTFRTQRRQVFEYRLKTDDVLRDYEARIVYLSNDRVMAIVRDITDRKAREAIIEEERARIARDLHDGLAQSLYFVGLKLDYLSKQADRENDSLAQELSTLKNMVQANIREIRRTIFALRPVNLAKLGFGPALRQYVDAFGEQANLHIALELSGDEDALPGSLEPILFRLVQEGLNNVAKHAQTDRAWVKLCIEPGRSVHLSIRDAGIGFSPGGLLMAENGRLGLSQMQQRVKLLGGQFTIDSQPMHGTILRADIPL